MDSAIVSSDGIHRAFGGCLYSGRSLTHDGFRCSQIAGAVPFAVGTDAVAESMVS